MPFGTKGPGLFGLSARGVYRNAGIAAGKRGLLLGPPKRVVPSREGRLHVFIFSHVSRPGSFPFCGTFRNKAVTSLIPSR